jgi:ADP-ribosylglycohydrolase
MAAAVAEALGASASIDSVLATATALAQDGTQRAVTEAIAAASPRDDLETFIARVRAAVAPFDQRTGHTADDQPLIASGVNDVGRPSRTASIEELPAALAALRYGDGDFAKTIRAAVCYGRDCDSIAGMAVGLYGALHGRESLPQALCRTADTANQRDFSALAAQLAATAKTIFAKDQIRFDRRTQSIL